MLYPCCVSSSKKLMILIRRSQRTSSSVLESWSALAPKMQCPMFLTLCKLLLPGFPIHHRINEMPHFVLLVKSAQAPVMLLHLSLIIPNCYLCWEGFYKRKSARQYVAKLSKFLGFSVLDPYRRKVCFFW